MTPFSKTVAFLEAQERGRPARIVAAVSLLILGWGLWLTLSVTNVYAVSKEGRLLAAGAASPVQTPVAGVVAESRLTLGAEVHAGDVLVVLDTSAESLRRDEEQAKLEGIRLATESLEAIITAERGLADATTRANATRMSSAAAKAAVAADVAALAKQQGEAMRRLEEASLVSGLEAMRAVSDTRRQRGQLVIERAETAAAAADLTRAVKEAEVRILGLERDLTELRSRASATRTVIAQLDWEIARRRLLAPVDGVVADVVPLPKGTALPTNQVLATIVPPTKMRWVAQFPVREAVGRIRPDQVARIRLDAFPWTAYGPLTAKVVAVGSEPRDQRVRVELEVVGSNPAVALSHGMTGATDVVVDQVSPLRLLMRLSGQLVQDTDPAPAVVDPPVARSQESLTP